MYSDQWRTNTDGHLQEENVRDARARRLESSRLRIALYKALQVDSYAERKVSLEKIIQVVKSYMRMIKSSSNLPFSPDTATATAKAITNEERQEQTEDDNQQEDPNEVITRPMLQMHDDMDAPMTSLDGVDEELQYFLLTMLRLSYTCPFRDVRHAFQQFLKTTLDAGIVPTPQPRRLSPSYLIPLQDIFSLESTSSVQNVISYPRPSNLSFSPWSHDASDGGNVSDSVDLNTNSSNSNQSNHQQQHQHQHPHHHHHQYPHPHHSNTRPSSIHSIHSHYHAHSAHHTSQSHNNSQSRLTPVASSFSSSTSSLLKASSVGDDDEDSDDASSMDDGASKTYSFTTTTRGKCTGGRPSDEYVRQMLVKSFLDEGRLTNVYRVMSFFPTFYEIFQLTMNNITKASIGPLHRTWRIYLGIMASAEQQCQYLVSTLKLDFLQNGGDPLWLKGIHHCPEKLQRIAGFVLKMARQPWRLTEDDLLALMTVSNPLTSSSSLNMTWSKGELVQAILVISSYLGFSNFVLSCGIAPEMDMYGGYYVRGWNACWGIENELDDNLQQEQQQQQKQQTATSFERRRQHLSTEEEMAIRAASSATGWYDSQVSPKSSKSSVSDGNGDDDGDDNNNNNNNDNNDYNDKGDDDDEATRSHQRQSFISDQGAGLGVSMLDSEEYEDEDEDSPLVDDGNEKYLSQTSVLISKLKSNKDAIKEELHQSLANLDLFAKSETSLHQEENQEGNAISDSSRPTSERQASGKVNTVYEDLTRFTMTPHMKQQASTLIEYEEFESGHEEYGEFMLSEYCWEDHGCDLVNHFLPGIGDELDDEFIESLSITDWSIFHQVADESMDTSPLRHAIFFYVQQLLGVTKEDYDYEDIAKYLSEQTQRYIRKVCRQPHLLNRNDWNNVGICLRSEEKCHMNLLIASARKQALLCYGLSLVSHV